MAPSTTTGWTIRELPAGTAPDGPDAHLLRAAVAAETAVLLETTGSADHARSERDLRAALADQRAARRIWLVALPDGPADEPAGTDEPAVLGIVAVMMPVLDNTFTATVGVAVRAEHRRRGIGSALWDAALGHVRAAGRTVVTTSTDGPAEPPPGVERLVAPTGSGALDATTPGVRFARARGFTLEQVARYSALDLPVPAAQLGALHDEAARAAGPGYRVLRWWHHCPEELVEPFCRLLERMSTDTPWGDLDHEPEVWDAARLRAREDELVARGHDYRVVAAQHVATGALVAYTSVWLATDKPAYADQDDTLVAAEHRGHRLGMLVKTAQLRDLATERPALRRIGTWNAAENGPMLAINVALGFRPAGASGEWQLRLS